VNATKWPRTMREIIERQLSLFGGENTRKPPDRSNLAHSRATARGFSRCSITSEETIVSNGRLQAVSRTLLAGAEARSRLRRQMRRYLEVYKAAAGAADTQRTISVDEDDRHSGPGATRTAPSGLALCPDGEVANTPA